MAINSGRFLFLWMAPFLVLHVWHFFHAQNMDLSHWSFCESLVAVNQSHLVSLVRLSRDIGNHAIPKRDIISRSNVTKCRERQRKRTGKALVMIGCYNKTLLLWKSCCVFARFIEHSRRLPAYICRRFLLFSRTRYIEREEGRIWWCFIALHSASFRSPLSFFQG